MAGEKYLDLEGLKRLATHIDEKLDDFLPVGSILMWSGTLDTVPKGWSICDGQNGTPDLRGRFVMGADEAHSPGAIGGESTHTLTVEELPAHRHTVSGVSLSEELTGGSLFSGGEQNITPAEGVETSETGGNSSFTILPPYYALAYIMKVKA